MKVYEAGPNANLPPLYQVHVKHHQIFCNLVQHENTGGAYEQEFLHISA
jgi:hypothetical protein